LPLYISKCAYKSKENINVYHMGKSIILPHVRYIDNGDRKGMMFHSQVVSSQGRCYTLGCEKMDVSGLCAGHKMSRREFLERYCGVEPGTGTHKE
jgi:hypothetical protein